MYTTTFFNRRTVTLALLDIGAALCLASLSGCTSNRVQGNQSNITIVSTEGLGTAPSAAPVSIPH